MQRLESCGKMPHLRFRTGNLVETQQFEIFMEFKRSKKHNDKNEVNANRYLAAMLNSFVIQKEEDIYKSSFDAIGNIR